MQLDSDLIECVNLALDASRAIISKHFRRPLVINLKSDQSPVTVVDLEVENKIKTILKASYADACFMGEETGLAKGNQSPTAQDSDETLAVVSGLSPDSMLWVIDPIDGTRSFMSGYPIFCTLIGLVLDAKFVLGAIDSPITGERWIGFKDQTIYTGKGIGHNLHNIKGHVCRTSDVKELGQALLAATTPAMFEAQAKKQFNSLAKQVRSVRWGGDAYNYANLASGYLDIIVEADLKFHDFGALIPVIENAGGVISDWHGRRLDNSSCGQVLASANPRIHEQALFFLS